MDNGSLHCTGGSDQDHPHEKEMQKGKMDKELRKENTEKAKEKRKDIPI